jgi:nucleoside-diphosphate-sugar epimerase
MFGAAAQGPQQSELSRDFTYVDDIVEGVIASLTHIPPSKPGSAHYKVRTLTAWMTTLNLTAILLSSVQFAFPQHQNC